MNSYRQRPSNFSLARFEHAHASYPGLSFRPPGSAPIWGGKKGEFRDWTMCKRECLLVVGRRSWVPSRGSWVGRRGSWVPSRGSWVPSRGLWVVGY